MQMCRLLRHFLAELTCVKIIVMARARINSGVRAVFRNFTGFDHDDAIGTLDRRQAVGVIKLVSTGQSDIPCRADQRFGQRINELVVFIQNGDIRLRQNRTGMLINCFLPDRQQTTTFTDLSRNFRD